ncbi:galactose-1-phosphate uridylyltransferase [Patescibacteria group bacterium]|nr:galactose-1-phosphate uridylyltransferase [Patescibacteria group bacterium]MBU4580014.1 galactose-1-phosphate uridylyltransferase [Patescibacteria group bacterium]
MSLSELRQDLVTGAWIVVATGRAKRPDDFKNKKEQKPDENLADCFFCDAAKMAKPVLVYEKSEGDWTLAVIPNKYPAFDYSRKLDRRTEGPFSVVNGVGYHEVIITRDHAKHIALMSTTQVMEIVNAYQDRYLNLMNKRFVDYISIFHNHGKEAGASVSHPHSQLIAMPVIDPDVYRSLNGSDNYWHQNKECVHCVMINWEKENKKRIIFENKDFIAFCPFASRSAFEARIYPKFHAPYFERITPASKIQLAEALRIVLAKINIGLDNPPYNFFLHTAPCDGKDYPHYHWHFEIMPKTSIWAGFELSTGIEISTIEPEKAAEFLREQEI